MDPYFHNREFDEHNERVNEEFGRLLGKLFPIALYPLGVGLLWSYPENKIALTIGVLLCLPVLFINIKHMRG